MRTQKQSLEWSQPSQGMPAASRSWKSPRTFQNSDLPNCGKIPFCCLYPSVCDHWLLQPQETVNRSILVRNPGFKSHTWQLVPVHSLASPLASLSLHSLISKKWDNHTCATIPQSSDKTKMKSCLWKHSECCKILCKDVLSLLLLLLLLILHLIWHSKWGLEPRLFTQTHSLQLFKQINTCLILTMSTFYQFLLSNFIYRIKLSLIYMVYLFSARI